MSLKSKFLFLPGRAGPTIPHWIQLLADRERCSAIAEVPDAEPNLEVPAKGVLGQE